MRIQHNIMAMNAYRNYNNNTRSLSGNLEKLSSGYKINRAGDDAAGLAISEKMRAQITGLDAAQKNVKDGISLVKTAEGAMQEIQDMLNRMSYLATQSANGTYDDAVDRDNLNKEVDALKEEIDRIADSANFNGIKLLDGTWAKEVSSGDTPAVDPNQYDMTELNMKKLSTQTAASALNSVTNASVDGSTPNAASSGQIKIKLAAGANLTDLKNKLDALTVASGASGGSSSVVDLFDVKLSDGTSLEDYLSDSSNSVTATDSIQITLSSKVAANYSTAVGSIGTALAAITIASDASVASGGATSVTISVTSTVAGNDIGEAGTGSDDNAVYEFKIQDVRKLQGGMKFEIESSAGNVAITFVGGQSVIASGDVKVSLDGLDAIDDDEDAAKELKKRVEDALTNATAAIEGTGSGKYEVEMGKVDGGSFSFKLIAQGTGTDGGTGSNKGQVKVSDLGIDNAISAAETSGIDGDSADAAGVHATATYDWEPKKLKEGQIITIGNTTLELVKDDDDEDFAAGKVSVDTWKDIIDNGGDATTTGTKKLNDILQAAGYDDGNVRYVDNKTISVYKKVKDDTTAAEWAADGGKVQTGTLKPTEEPAEPADPSEAKGGKALTLQIGDTPDQFNKMSIHIGDMHVNAMGLGKYTDGYGNEQESTQSIADISIATQDDAAAAVYTIKNAINYVSSIRGDLGAVQNRLEHTQNNLSVMAENIQDAESTIRDTDVADEMMSYVKNNILVQSAQAMLAQANQVPQGVLQLLG